MSEDPNLNSRLSVRRMLPGMTAVSKNTSTGITPSAGVKKMLRNASVNKGCVKIQIKNQVLVGKSVGSKNLVEREWSDKMDGLRKYLDESDPCYIACWREAKDCLLITFIPETTPPRGRMLYAGTRDALKVSIGEIDESGKIEEYNITDAEDLSYAAYDKQKNVPLAYSEYELEKMEIEQQEKQEMEERSKRMKEMKGKKNAPPVALLGLSVAAAVVAQGKAGGGRLNVKEAVKAANESKVKPAKKPPKVLEKAQEEEEEKQTQEELEEEIKEELNDLQKAVEEEEEHLAKVEEEEEEEEKLRKEAAAREAEKKAKEEEEAAEKKAKEEEEKAKAKAEKEEEKETTVVSPLEGGGTKAKQKIKNSFKFFKEKVQQGASAVKPKKKGPSEEELEKYPADDGQHTLSELQKMVEKKEYGDVDKSKIEMYLSSREFFKTFHVEKDKFDALPGWKKKRLKTENKLF